MTQRPRPKYTEPETSAGVRTLLAPSGHWYSTEAGAMGHWDPNAPRKGGGKGRFVTRKGGTRTTPGIPDLVWLMRDPIAYVLFIEAKGADTSIEEEQWRFQARAALLGIPSLIVRTPDAMLQGLHLLGLLPKRLLKAGKVFWSQYDERERPENVNYLTMMRTRFWINVNRMPPYPLPAIEPNARRKEPPWPLGPEWR